MVHTIPTDAPNITHTHSYITVLVFCGLHSGHTSNSALQQQQQLEPPVCGMLLTVFFFLHVILGKNALEVGSSGIDLVFSLANA